MNAVESITTAIEDALRLIHETGDVFEVRIPKAGRAGTVSGYYTDHAKAAADIVKRDGKVPGIYVTLNPVDPALMARSANRLKERAADTTSDRDVVRRRQLLIDVDFNRSAGISATDEELNAAGREAQQIEDLHLPTRPTKKSDSRAKKFKGESVEVDAIPAKILRELAEQAIVQHVDEDSYRLSRVAEDSERRLLKAMAGSVAGRDGGDA